MNVTVLNFGGSSCIFEAGNHVSVDRGRGGVSRLLSRSVCHDFGTPYRRSNERFMTRPSTNPYILMPYKGVPKGTAIADHLSM